MSILFTLHLLAATLWVGGMFFAYMALRPVAASLLEPPIRLALWRAVFKKFFFWVWLAVVILPASGYYLIFSVYHGMKYTPVPVHIMQLTGLIMIAIFIYLFFSPYKKLILHLENNAIPDAAKQLNQIRQFIAINLTLGIATIIIASTSHFFI